VALGGTVGVLIGVLISGDGGGGAGVLVLLSATGDGDTEVIDSGLGPAVDVAASGAIPQPVSRSATMATASAAHPDRLGRRHLGRARSPAGSDSLNTRTGGMIKVARVRVPA
jgi:hypothetical protein